MKREITKRQHVVNRKYLSMWGDENENVFCLNDSGRIFSANPINLCVMSYFYRFEEINFLEKELILSMLGKGGREYLIANSNDCSTLKDVFNYMLELDNRNYPDPVLHLLDIVMFCALSKKIIDTSINVLPHSSVQLYENTIKEGVETIETFFESLGYPFLNKIYNHDYKNLQNDLPDFIEYICVQFTRTNTMKQKNSHLDNSKVDILKIWSVLHLVTAAKLADSLLGYKLTITIIENKSSTHFITGDQPVINMKASTDGTATEALEFYYPISPQLAIKILPENRPKKISFKVTGILPEEIHNLNFLIKSFSKCIYGNISDDLTPYQKTI